MVEVLPLARTWVHGIQSGRPINVGDRMQMYDLVHRQIPLVSDQSEFNALWGAFEDCVNLGIAQLLASPSTVRELYSRLDAMAHFHEYAQSLLKSFRALESWLGYVQAADPILQRLDYWPDRPRNMREVIKLMLQDRVGLPPASLGSEIPGCDDDIGLRRFPNGVVDCKRIDSLLLPFLDTHGAEHTDWLLPSPYAFVPLPLKTKLAFLLCSKRAESPVSRLTIEIIKRIFLLAHGQCQVCREGSGGKEGMIPGSPQASFDGFQASTYFAGARHDCVFKTGCHGVGYYLDHTVRNIAELKQKLAALENLVRITYAKSLESDIAVQ